MLKIEKNISIAFLIAFFIFSSQASSLAGIRGDTEILNLIANGYDANMQKLRTWKGQAMVEGYSSPIASVGWGEKRWVRKDDLLISLDSNSFRWFQVTVKSTELKDSKLIEKSGQRNAGLDKDLYEYRLSYSDNDKLKRYLTIYSRNTFPKTFNSEVFNPFYALKSLDAASVSERLRYYYVNSKDPCLSHVSVTRQENLVTVVSIIAKGNFIGKYIFDLSKGCMPVECLLSSDISENFYTFGYENISGVFVLKNASYRYKDKRQAMSYESSIKVSLINEMVNTPVEASEFEVDKIGMRPGDIVHDQVSEGISYTWDGLSKLPILENIDKSGRSQSAEKHLKPDNSVIPKTMSTDAEKYQGKTHLVSLIVIIVIVLIFVLGFIYFAFIKIPRI
jgi:hypothetical protein